MRARSGAGPRGPVTYNTRPRKAPTVKKSDFHFDLPGALIAQAPLPERSASRLLVTVRRENLATFQQLLGTHLGFDAALIGNVANTGTLVVAHGEEEVLHLGVEELAEAFKATLRW